VARRRRRALAAADPDAASKAAGRLPHDLPPFAVAAGYLAMGAELDPAPLLARLRKVGARILLPRVDGPALVFEDDAAALTRPDVVIAPLLAFDARGNRLGQGGGHYDRAIATLRADGHPLVVIGLAYAGQEVPELPAEPHDQRLDAVLTEMDYRAFAL